VTTKKKEVLGNLKMGAKPIDQKATEKVEDARFPDPNWARAVPYGVYTIHGNVSGRVGGISHDTGRVRGWKPIGVGGKKRVASGMSSQRVIGDSRRRWQQQFAVPLVEGGVAEVGGRDGAEIVEVSHYPPGTSKWNKIEHRCSATSRGTWQGTPLETFGDRGESIGATTTENGIGNSPCMDRTKATYEKGQSKRCK